MSDQSNYHDLVVRVAKFQRLELPGQMPVMHMGTSYLVHDLWQEVQFWKNLYENQLDLSKEE